MQENNAEETRRLILSLIETRRPATKEERERILAQTLQAPFTTRSVRVTRSLEGKEYLGYYFGRYAPSHLAHLGKRVLVEKQWKDNTTLEEYLKDIKNGLRHREAKVAVYHSRGTNYVGVLSPNNLPASHLGEDPYPWIWVIYDADRGIINFRLPGIIHCRGIIAGGRIMAVTAKALQRLEYLLDYLDSSFSQLEDYYKQWDELEKDTKDDFIIEWPIVESKIKSLHEHVAQFGVPINQKERYQALLERITHDRELLESLRERP